jgi:hypothetical protein
MYISMIKKIKADGSPCRKCAEIEKRLEVAGLTGKINRIIIADERDPETEGMRLAAQHNVDRAPFFIVEEDGKAPRIFTIYMKFLKEVLEVGTSDQDAVKDIMDANPDLDYI